MLLIKITHLNQIIYLDYRLVDQNIRSEGLKKYEIDIGQLWANEEAEEKVKRENDILQNELKQNKVIRLPSIIFYLNNIVGISLQLNNFQGSLHRRPG